MTVNGKSRTWHFVNSLWVLLALLPLVCWAPFWIVGGKVNHKPYKISAYVHTAIAVCLFLGILTVWEGGCLAMAVIHYFVIIIHCLVIRKKYLRLLSQKEAKRQIEKKLAAGEMKPVSAPADIQQVIADAVAAPVAKIVPAEPVKKLNVNSCTEEQLCALPGIGIVEAKKMMALREKNGDFSSVEAFIVAVGIKPHVAVHIVDAVCAEPTEVWNSGKKGVRILDI